MKWTPPVRETRGRCETALFQLRLIFRFVAFIAIAWAICLLSIIFWSTRNVGGQADVIVVLGAAQYAGRPSPVLQSRLDHALALWQEKRAPLVLVTGGRRDGDILSEAAAGKRYLVRHGVPAAAILEETKSRTSRESLHGASAILLADKRMPATPTVLLVSDPFHMMRLYWLAKLHGLSPLTSPTRTSPISANRSVAIEYILRESIALPADVGTMLWQDVRR